jgi:uncharacterized membrane-anchored protein
MELAPCATAFLIAFCAAPAIAQDPAPAEKPETPAVETPDEMDPDAEQDSASPLDSFEWVEGPNSGELGRWAVVQVPADYRYLGAEDTQRLMEQMQNPVSKHELGFLAPDDLHWFAIFEFDDSGFVKDDEKDKLDPDAILASIREGNEQGNAERKKRGWSTLEILGWAVPPHYDPTTHNLEWATKARDDKGNAVVNLDTRILGRGGVMSVTLVVEPEKLEEATPEFKEALTGFEYKSGQRYAEYKSGDKLATYGLTALVAGGAGAIAAKTGMFAKLWKFLVAAVVAIGAWLKKVFGGKDKSTRAKRDALAAQAAEAAPELVEGDDQPGAPGS